jgi:uncharacterized protein
MDFEWDTEKAEVNLSKHGIRFDDAIRVFADNCRIINVDNRKDYGEERLITTGHIENRLCVVVYTEKLDVIRIISARKANKKEQIKYDNYQKNY